MVLPAGSALIAACTEVNWQPLAQTSPQTHAPPQQVGVLPSQVVPQAPQFAASVSVFVQLPGEPQHSGVPPEQAPPLPHWHWLFTQSLPAGAHSASAQQIPAKQEPPQQTCPAPHWLAFVQAEQVPLRQIGSGLLHWPLSQHSWHVPAQQMLPPPHVAPSASVVQVPTDPPRLHAWHAPSQAVSQQTPSTQKPERHCPLLPHGSPSGKSSVQCPASQKEPGTHSASSLQLVAQALPSQRVYGAQETGSAGSQTPLPLQLPCGCSVPFSQVAVSPQGVPASCGTQVPGAPAFP
jgi:hypothetical protein